VVLLVLEIVLFFDLLLVDLELILHPLLFGTPGGFASVYTRGRNSVHEPTIPGVPPWQTTESAITADARAAVSTSNGTSRSA
jgi:hypothetical protein